MTTQNQAAKIDFTVAIPTYNGARRLPSLLTALLSQTKVNNITWEVLLIDNNSSDNTLETLEEFSKIWTIFAPLRYIFVKEQGLYFARKQAFNSACGEFIGFLDDDTLPSERWVFEALSYGRLHPCVGAYSGSITADFTECKPKEFNSAQRFLSIRNYAQAPTSFDVENLRLPPGAGLVVRSEAWLRDGAANYNEKFPTQRGGEDYKICILLYVKGWEIHFNPAMEIKHLIPAWRMEKAYLMPVVLLYGLRTAELQSLLAKNKINLAFALMRIMVGSSRRIFTLLLRCHWRTLKDIDSACDFAFLCGQFLSPIYYLFFLRK